MTFVKGRAKTGGITKGQQWKKTLEWEDFGQKLMQIGLPRMLDIMEQSTDEEFAKHFKDLLEYFKPKMQRTEITQQTQHVVFDMSMLSNEDLERLTRL